MNKARVEAFSDGVFSIVLTLLVFNLHVPTLVHMDSNKELLFKLGLLWPSFASFLLSFLVVSVFWINHHFLFRIYIKEVDRITNLLNILYLLFLVFIPFSSNLFGDYPQNQVAALIYGFNILATVFVLRFMISYIRHRPEHAHDVPSRIEKQARIRTTLTVGSYLIGVICTFFFIPASVFFYLFPMLFNIIPGTLTIFERIFGFEIG